MVSRLERVLSLQKKVMTTIIKNGKRISNIFSKIEDKELEFLVKETGVDKYSKKLKGIEIFKLLIFGTLTDDRASLRTFENFYITNFFKMIVIFCLVFRILTK